MRVEMQRRQDLPNPAFTFNAPADERPPLYFPPSSAEQAQNPPSSPAHNPAIIDLTTQNPHYASASYQTPPPPQNTNFQMPPPPQNANLQTGPHPQSQNTYPQNYQATQNAQSPSIAPPLPQKTTFQIPVPNEHDVNSSELDHYEEREREWRSKEETAKLDMKKEIRKAIKELQCIPEVNYQAPPPTYQTPASLYQNTPQNYQAPQPNYQTNPYPRYQAPRPNAPNYRQMRHYQMIETDDDWCVTKAIVPIAPDNLERAVASLSIREKNEFVILTPEKVVALVPRETLDRSKFVIETTVTQGMTRSGRCYTPEELSHGVQKKEQSKRPISEAEAEEFWRKMQPKDYSIVKHLEKTPAQISVWALLMSSQMHRQALMRALDDTYVPVGTNSDNLAAMINQVIRGHRISFCDEELPFEGKMHNRALHITCIYRDKIINCVLVDDGSGLNICPLSTLRQLKFDVGKLRQNQVNVRAFGGVQRDTLGMTVYSYGWGCVFYSSPNNEIHLEGLGIGFGLGKNFQGIVEPIQIPARGAKFGLGYVLADDEAERKNKNIEYVNDDGLGEGIWGLFKEIDAVIEEDAGTSGIRDTEPEEQLQNWSSTPFLISRAACNINLKPANVMSCHKPNEQNEAGNDECEVYEDESEVPEYVAEEFRQFENQHKPNLEETETVNLGDEECVKEVKISVHLTEAQRMDLVRLLGEYIDVFSWSYKDMPGLSTNMVSHKLPINPFHR
ncbi:hypothetical protein R3W88_022037 [Solanum pinnatisectum]|uniref:Uncharacterized protein n=1 Tax=Solanum pinnatisectum TaxID=50273 RepID=A0AAV9LWX1_9SOLN|nr:hypothetical protein R3W88_022037 [Solanum pinnatisectum]